MSCTLGFVNDVIFLHSGATEPESKTTRMFRRVRQMAAMGARLLSTIAGLLYVLVLLLEATALNKFMYFGLD